MFGLRWLALFAHSVVGLACCYTIGAAHALTACAGPAAASDDCVASKAAAEALENLGSEIQDKRSRNSGRFADHFGIYALSFAGPQSACETRVTDYDDVTPGTSPGSGRFSLSSYWIGWGEEDAFLLQTILDKMPLRLSAMREAFVIKSKKLGTLRFSDSGHKMGAFALSSSGLLFQAKKTKGGASFVSAPNCGDGPSILDTVSYHLGAVAAGPYLLQAAGDDAHSPDKIIANAQRAIQLARSYWPAHIWLAIGQLGKGQHSSALAEVNTVLTYRPQSADALALRGNILLKLGDRASALKDFEAALAQDGSNFYAYRSLQQARRVPPQPMYFNPYAQPKN